MTTLASASFTPTPPGEGLIQRVANAIRNITDDSPPTLRRLASKLFGKVPTPAAAPDAPQVPERPANKAPAAAPGPPKPDPVLDGWTAAERAELSELETYMASLETEDERDRFTAGLLADIRRQVDASAPPKPMKHADFLRLPFREANAFMREGGKLVP